MNIKRKIQLAAAAVIANGALALGLLSRVRHSLLRAAVRGFVPIRSYARTKPTKLRFVAK